MTSSELQSIQKEIKFDCPSMAKCIGIPYNTYKNLFYGINAINEQVARKILEIQQINLVFSAGMPGRIEAHINKLHPFGFMSEVEKEAA